MTEVTEPFDHEAIDVPRNPVLLAWRHIDGILERDAQGLLWASAPPWRGSRAWWACETLQGGVEGRGEAHSVLVVRASRRQRCELGRGRYVDLGEMYSDRATRAWTERMRLRRPPTKIDGGVLPASDGLLEFLRDS